MNKWIGIGRLVRDPDVRYTQGNEPMCVAKFTLAVSRSNKKDETDFISCTAFGRNGQFAEKYLHKGSKIALEGKWQTGSYENKEGQKVYTNDCIVDHIEFAESRTEETKKDDFIPVNDAMVEELPFS